MTTADRLTLIVDWSAASSPGPARPTKDRCWTAASGDVAPRYHRTRAACVAYLLETLRAHSGPALLGFDFPLAHPSFQGEPVLPAGRDLAEMLAVRITDSGDDSNNRFEVAAAINHEICDRFGLDHGPFWGFVGPSGVRPPAGLTATRPACPIPEFRACELELIERGLRPQSAWKLAYPASVGSQTLTGMARLHSILTDAALADRCRVWPFEEPLGREDEIVIAEVWLGLFEFDREPYLSMEHAEIRDARQVMATRDAQAQSAVSRQSKSEGAILGEATIRSDP